MLHVACKLPRHEPVRYSTTKRHTDTKTPHHGSWRRQCHSTASAQLSFHTCMCYMLHHLDSPTSKTCRMAVYRAVFSALSNTATCNEALMPPQNGSPKEPREPFLHPGLGRRQRKVRNALASAFSGQADLLKAMVWSL